MHRFLIILLILLLLCVLEIWWKRRRKIDETPVKPSKPKTPRPLKPRTPKDCAECRREAEQDIKEAPPKPDVIPWSQVKSTRGRKKGIRTEGYACQNKKCKYCGITDERIHALVGYGCHGKRERIQNLYCQACKTKFSVRRNTPLYRLKTPAWRVVEILATLAEGLDVAAAERAFGHTEATIQRWLTRAGEHAGRMHTRFFRNLDLKHVQLDELKTRLRSKASELWLWVALDVQWCRRSFSTGR